jgi:Ammonia permease
MGNTQVSRASAFEDPAPASPITAADQQFEIKRADKAVPRTAKDNLNIGFNEGDQAYIIVSAAMVMIMVPGIAFLYSGLARRKSALSLIWVVMMSYSVIVFQWYFWGYSLALSPTATNGYIGNLDKFGLKGVLGDQSPGSPLVSELLYSFYQVSHIERLEDEVAGG